MTSTRVKKTGSYYRLDPVPTDADLTTFYESRYYDLIRKGGRAPELRKMSEGGASAERELQWLRAGMYADLEVTLRDLAPGCSRVLDIGAGTGAFVSYLREREYDAEGIEPAKEPAEAARKRGLPIHTSTLSAWVGDASHASAYDAVVMLNVLEHVPDPEAMIEAAHKLLRRGGHVVVRVPNDFSEIQDAARQALSKEPWWVCAPDHINYFNVESLQRVVGNCGFEVARAMTDFPMEFFLLMGDDYVGNPQMGAAVHERRVRFDLNLPPALRCRLYTALATVGVGRNVTVFGRKLK